jgi:hypothetical protein
VIDDDDPTQEPEDLPLEADLPLERASVDSGTKRGHKRQLRKADLALEEERRFWEAVFGDTVGRRCMWKLLAQAHPFETSFGVSGGLVLDQYATWFEAGKQGLGMKLFQDWLMLARDGVLLMLDENEPRFAAAASAKKRRGF